MPDYYYQPGTNKKCEYCGEIYYHTHTDEEMQNHLYHTAGCRTTGIYLPGDILNGNCTCTPVKRIKCI